MLMDVRCDFDFRCTFVLGKMVSSLNMHQTVKNMGVLL